MKKITKKILYTLISLLTSLFVFAGVIFWEPEWQAVLAILVMGAFNIFRPRDWDDWAS